MRKIRVVEEADLSAYLQECIPVNERQKVIFVGTIRNGGLESKVWSRKRMKQYG